MSSSEDKGGFSPVPNDIVSLDIFYNNMKSRKGSSIEPAKRYSRNSKLSHGSMTTEASCKINLEERVKDMVAKKSRMF